MSGLLTYLNGVVFEGLLIGGIFWVVTYITIESSSLWVALRSALLAEIVGNIPYFWDLPYLSPPALAMSLLAAFIFARLVIRAGELQLGKVLYGTTMTYFVLVALVTCNA